MQHAMGLMGLIGLMGPIGLIGLIGLIGGQRIFPVGRGLFNQE